jgi:hypothetical protein
MWVNWVGVLWILYDVGISIRTSHMQRAFSDGEWYAWFFGGLVLAVAAFVAAFFDRRADQKQIAGLNSKLDEQKERAAEQRGISLGSAAAFGRRLEDIENKVTDPQSKAEISELREEVIRKPVIVYESFDEGTFAWKTTEEKYNYVHLWFQNEPTGGTAHDAAAKLSWWDIRYTDQKPLFSVDGKWYEVSAELGKRVQAENTIDLLPNRASHGLDLFVHKPGADWNYGLDVTSSIKESHRLLAGIYKVRVTISCEGYTKDFYFRVATGFAISVQEYASPDGEGQEVKDEVRR